MLPGYLTQKTSKRWPQSCNERHWMRGGARSCVLLGSATSDASTGRIMLNACLMSMSRQSSVTKRSGQEIGPGLSGRCCQYASSIADEQPVRTSLDSSSENEFTLESLISCFHLPPLNAVCAASLIMQKKMNILGINMDCLSYSDMHSIFKDWLRDKNSRSHSLALVNVNCCVSALFDQGLRRLYNSADMVGIDSMPFLKWARTFYDKNSDRLYAPDVMLEVSSKAKERGYTFFLYGGAPDAPNKLEAYLSERFE